MVEFFPNFPPIHFGLGAIENIGSELVSRGIKRPLILTDRGLVKHGVMQKLLDALPDELEFSILANVNNTFLYIPIYSDKFLYIRIYSDIF